LKQPGWKVIWGLDPLINGLLFKARRLFVTAEVGPAKARRKADDTNFMFSLLNKANYETTGL
jgi:hypothetical protein